EMNIAPRSVRIAFGASGRSATVCMVVSRVGGRNLTLPERRSLSTSPWDLDRLRCCERPQEIAEIVGERMKLEPALAANVRHDNRVHLIAPLPSLIHCSQVPRLLSKATTFLAGRAMLVTMKPT